MTIQNLTEPQQTLLRKLAPGHINVVSGNLLRTAYVLRNHGLVDLGYGGRLATVQITAEGSRVVAESYLQVVR